MPVCSDRTGPSFDQANPKELLHFFDELEYLFDCTGMTMSKDRKNQLLCYVTFDMEQTWHMFPEFEDDTKIYDNLKKAIFQYFPDICGESTYMLQDMDLLIGECQQLGIPTMQELTVYHLQFMTIMSWLIKK